MTRPVTPAEVDAYRRDGWVRLDGLLDEEELRTVRASVQRASIQADREARDESLGEQAYRDLADYREMLQQLTNLHLHDPALERIARDASLSESARRLIGSTHARLFLDQTVVKPPAREGTRPTPWHQDYPHQPLDRRGTIALWIALEDVTEEMGALSFVSGSHRVGPLGRARFLADVRRATPGGSWPDPPVTDLLRPDDLPLIGETVTVPLRAGDATAHDSLTLHRAGPNRADRPRIAWSIVYIPADARYTGAPYFNTDDLALRPLDELDHPQFPVVA